MLEAMRSRIRRSGEDCVTLGMLGVQESDTLKWKGTVQKKFKISQTAS